jgi:LysR family transcriptional activator of nhaA
MIPAVDWLNYHHLLYFWTVARAGGLAPASKLLRLARPTLSGQIHALEESLGEKLFQREGRRLVLTEMGRVAFRYADEIFTLGSELVDTVKGRSAGGPPRLDIGVAQVVPKLIVHRLLEPALRQPSPLRLVCHEEAHERLLARLALHELDAVISDAPVPAGGPVRAHHHLLGDTGVTFFAARGVAAAQRRFPRSLDAAPVLLPIDGTSLRRALNLWFEAEGVKPRVVGEFEDSALLKAFGSRGAGIFTGPTAVEDEIRRQYRVEVVGRVSTVRERFYAITVERRLRHPAVVAICKAARAELFA